MKRCRYSACGKKFTPRYRSTEIACSDEHALAWAREQPPKKREQTRKRIANVAKREGRDKLKTVRDRLKEAQRAFNAFIRERDHYRPCICCGKYPTSKDTVLRGHLWDAGHYRSIGAASHLRFNEDNCFRQLVQCNRDKSGNAVEYRRRLIERIGTARVEALENDNTPRKWTAAELVEICRTYRRKLRELRAQREARAA